MYSLTLPYPPSLNSLYKIAPKPYPHIYLSAKGKEYKKLVNEYIHTNDLVLKANIPLSVTVVITPPDNRKRDLDNLFKILFDSLTGAEFWEDDVYVKALNVSYKEPNKPGGLLLTIKPLEDYGV